VEELRPKEATLQAIKYKKKIRVQRVEKVRWSAPAKFFFNNLWRVGLLGMSVPGHEPNTTRFGGGARRRDE
jgi:hypothetical protein